MDFKLPFKDHAERDFLYALAASLLFYLSLGLLVQSIQLPEHAREDFERIPPRIAKLILETPKPKPKLPLPPPPAKTKKPKEKPVTPEPTKPKEVKKRDDPKPEKAQEPPKPPSPEEVRLRLEQEAKARQKKNREIAMQSGILKLLTKEVKKPAQEKRLEKDLEKVFSPGAALEKMQKSTITKNQRQKKVISESGGIDDLIASLQETGSAEDIEGGFLGLDGPQVAQVESPIEIKGGSGQDASRSYASIKETVDALTGWIRFNYNRGLRQDPTLKGTVTLEFTILPSGQVADCRVLSSSLNYKLLEDRLVKRFSQLVFDPIPEGTNIVIYPITLAPSG